MSKNIDSKTVEDFGNEWSRFNQENLSQNEHRQIFYNYFEIFPFEKLPENAVAADIGCGSGRWAKLVADKVKKLYCIDASIEALEVAKKNLSNYNNIEYLNESVDSITIENNSLDFAYSLGVLHHMPNTKKGIVDCVAKIKKGGYFLLYLYYNLDNKPLYFKLIWQISNLFREVISRMPSKMKFLSCEIIAMTIYWPFSRLSQILEKFDIKTKNIPLSYYKDKSFYTMRTDALDRFGTRLEQRFSKEEIEEMMKNAGLTEIKFSQNEPYWVAVGKKCVE